jgi:prepilin-type N-terminal cleavage/methylation domain-containing protein
VKTAKRGFTLIELVVALILAVMVIGIAWHMMSDQRSNMVGIRQRLRSQAVAREALKTIESEIRITGFGQQFVFMAGPGGRVDSLDAAGVSTCPAISGATNSTSVWASDGASGGNDTLSIAYPTVVVPATGTDCTQLQWSRYYVDKDTNLVRVTAPTFAGLKTPIDSSVAAKGVDVFQIRLAVSGGGISPLAYLTTIGEICCATVGNFTSSNASQSGTDIKVVPTASANWSLLSVQKTLKAGERWRDTFTIEPNTAFITDLKAGATLTAGLYNAGAGASAAMNLLTRPDNDLALNIAGTGLEYTIDLAVPADGNYRLGFKGTAKATASTSLLIHGLNASRVGNPPGATWWKNPGPMAAGDWSGVKQVEVLVLSRSESMDDARASKFTGLANFVKSAGPVGEFSVTDKRLRSLFDHVYPVGNNGTN